MQIFWIAVAGATGVVLRYLMSSGVTRVLGTAFPYATVLINVLGSFAIGAIYVVAYESATLGKTTAVALMVGLLGGFTTFSSFSLETIRMIEGGQWGLAAINVAGSVLFCLLAVAAGIFVARLLS